MDIYFPSDDYPAIILENGTSTCRLGFAGQDAPTNVVPNMIGRQRVSDKAERETFIGYDAQDRRELLSLTYPVKHGIVHNWDDMEKIWNYSFFSELKASPEQHPILTTEAPLNPIGNQEKTAELMFETYKTPAFYTAFEPVLTLFSGGKCDGTIVSCGEGVTYVSPITEGYTAAPTARIDFGGRDLTLHLQHLLYKKGFSFTTNSELDIVRQMKEAMCYIKKDSTDVVSELSYKLPDGSYVKLESERQQCPEILYNPDGTFNQDIGLQKLVVDTINNCELDWRAHLRKLIILSGGTTLMSNFISRLEKEVLNILPEGSNVRIMASPERKYHVWIGGSILASLSTFNLLWISRQEYNEFGPSILHRKSIK